jgi:serine-type D-Ala-D-Ala carboxypeptidase/endopeptidase (penicillin-binding protein 4)
VYLVGRGDPSLVGSSAEKPQTPFDRLAEALLAAGVRRIEGRLIGQEGLFSGERRGEDWVWGDLIWYYGSEVAALTFNNSAVHLRVRSGERAGDPVTVERNPVSSYYQVVSTATTSAPGQESDLTLTRPLGSETIYLQGTHPQAARPDDLFVAVEDPARFAATVFAETLMAKGIRVQGPVETSQAPLPAGLRTLAFLTSPTLAEIVKDTNQRSQNQWAEMLLRLVGLRAQREGSAQAGLAAVRAFLERQGVSQAGWALYDGSGLSRSDLVTAGGLVQLLTAMSRHPQARAFKESLPLVGSEGTVRRRMKGTAAEGRIRAKSGSIKHDWSLVGYATNQRGQPLAFAILLNHYTGDQGTAFSAIDEICQAIVGH